MTDKIQHERWAVSNEDFAVRIIVPDLQGFIGRSLVIEPGTRALIVDDGVLVGEVPPGEYTFESFVDRLEFWRKKQTTVFLVRCEDVPIDSVELQVPCQDAVCCDVTYNWTVQVKDILQFMHNLMGARESLTVTELAELLSPIVGQATYATIGLHSYDELHTPDFVNLLSDGLRSRIDVKLQRYGLNFVDLQSADCAFDDAGIADRKGEQWLHAREGQLQQAASKIENDQLAAKLEDIRAKLPVRQQLRTAVAEDQLGKSQSRETFAAAIAEIDKQGLIRKEERNVLLEAYEERKGDRGELREHLLKTIDIQRQQELEELRIEMNHAVRMKSLEQELELTRLTQTQESAEWQHEIEREREQADHHHQQKLKEVRAAWDRARETQRQKRDDSWEGILHEQKLQGVREEIQLAKAERTKRIALMESELNARIKVEKLDVLKRQQEWELEHKTNRSTNQLDRLQRVQEMNAQFAERQQKMQVELENLKADSASKRDLDRINAMASLGTEALVATAGPENAALLADMKKHEATQAAVKVQVAASPVAELNEERLRLYEKMNETERAKADGIADAYKLAMQSQQGNVNQMIGGLAQAATPAAPAPAGFPPAVISAAAPPPMPAAEVWHVSLDGQQSPALQLVQVQQYIQSGQVDAGTNVWKTGMASWIPAGQIPELAGMLRGGPAAPPPMTPGPPGPPPA